MSWSATGPVFHLNAAWMLAFGVVVLRAGLGAAG